MHACISIDSTVRSWVTKLPVAIPESYIPVHVAVPPALLLILLPTHVPWKTALGDLSMWVFVKPIQESNMEFLDPGCTLTKSWLLRPFGVISRWKISPTPSYHSVFQIHLFFLIQLKIRLTLLFILDFLEKKCKNIKVKVILATYHSILKSISLI